MRAQEIDSYDNQQRLYQTQVYDVNPTTGAVSTSALTTNYYYDHRGDLMAEADPGGLWTKSVYDGAGRDVMDYTTDGAYGTYWVEAATVAHDTVLEQEQTVYDGDSNVIETIDSQRFHNASGTGALGSPSSGIGARVSYAAAYYDNVDRLTSSVDVGTNGGTAWTRPNTAPASSATALVSTYAYNYTPIGFVLDATDPMGIDTRTLYDNLGRTTETIQDYTGGTPGNENDITTQYGYDGNNNVTYVQADEPGRSYQQTQYVYGVTTASGSGVNSNDILSAIQYPDPTTGQPGSQQETYLVNALGQTVQSTDRANNVHQYTYDVLGRETSDNVTQLGSGVDGTVRQITYAYDSQGNPYLITSLNGSGGIVNQVEDVYNGLGQLTGEYQSHNLAVNTSTTPEVQYAYTEMSGGQNNSRLTSMTYPDGYVLNYNYNTGLDSNISRLSSISDASNTLESYKYLGLDTVVERDHPQDNVNQTYISQNGQTGDAGDQYVGLDRFGRIVDQNWYNTTTQTSTDNFAYGYNQDGDVLYKQNLVDTAMSELYQYDNLHQLTNFQRGTLNSTDNGIFGTPSASQSWSPDALGNFNSVTTGTTTQTRTANQQNEITSISGQSAPTYDANGNLTSDGTGNTYVYNAWNELVAVEASGHFVVASYSYDGLGRRIVETGMSIPTTDLYYSSADQVLEEDVAGVTQARNVWSIVYVNALVLRDQSSQHNGVLDQRLYVQEDANWDVTALVSTSGTVLERYTDSPYGTVTVLSSNWVVQNDTNYSVPYLWQGMRYEWATNLYFADDREYDPALMTWMQTDPLGLNAGNNDYEPMGDEPTDAVDPSGLEAAWFSSWSEFKKTGSVIWGGVNTVAANTVAASAGISVPIATAVGTQAVKVSNGWKAYQQWAYEREEKYTPWRHDPRYNRLWFVKPKYAWSPVMNEEIIIGNEQETVHWINDWPWYANLERLFNLYSDQPGCGMAIPEVGGASSAGRILNRIKALEAQYDPSKTTAVNKSIGRQLAKLRGQAAAEAKALAKAAAVAEKGKLASELADIGRQASTKTGNAARTLLEGMAQRAGLLVKSGGEHLRVETPGGRLVTTIPHSPKGSGTIRSIAKAIVDNIQD